MLRSAEKQRYSARDNSTAGYAAASGSGGGYSAASGSQQQLVPHFSPPLPPPHARHFAPRDPRNPMLGMPPAAGSWAPVHPTPVPHGHQIQAHVHPTATTPSPWFSAWPSATSAADACELL
jgi:hypothetical protein